MNRLLIGILLLFGMAPLMVWGQSWNELKVEKKPILVFTVNDTLAFPVFVVETPADSMLYYGTQLETNVCNDQVCLPIQVNLFWDLLGNFHHFSKEKQVHFTKFDHQYFDEHDYSRLQSILIDSLSPLRDYQVEDLLDKKADKYSLEVDAVTRPTSAIFSNVTVSGALYTVYTLWHIVNGPIKQTLKEYVNTHYLERNWISYFADSQNPAYQEYFIKQLDSLALNTYQDKVVDLLFAKDDYVPHYALEALHGDFLKNADQYNTVLKQLGKLKTHVLTELLNSISNMNQETKLILMDFRNGNNASVEQKSIINKILNYEE